MNTTTKPVIDIKAHPVRWDAEDRKFSCYISELPQWAQEDIGRRGIVRLLNPDTGQTAIFNFTATDVDREGEISGWRYSGWSPDVRVNLLIIND